MSEHAVVTPMPGTFPGPSLAAVDEHVFLIGRPPVGEYLGFIRSMSVDGQSRDQGALVEEWRRANDHVRRLERTEAGIADRVTTLPLPSELNERRERLLREPMFQRAFQYVPTELAMVELDRLVVCQKHIDLSHVAKLQARISARPGAAELFDLCLPPQRENPPVRLMQTAPNSFTFVSPSNDFRFLQTEIFTPRQLGSWSQIGTATDVIGLAFGYGSNYLNALSLEGRLVLGNGSHRAYALRELGVTHVPCLVQKLSRREELELTATADLQQHPDRFLRAARPPLLKDYLDPALRMVVPVVRKSRLVKLTFAIEGADIPAQ